MTEFRVVGRLKTKPKPPAEAVAALVEAQRAVQIATTALASAEALAGRPVEAPSVDLSSVESRLGSLEARPAEVVRTETVREVRVEVEKPGSPLPPREKDWESKNGEIRFKHPDGSWGPWVKLGGGGGGGGSSGTPGIETDPVFTASPAAGIAALDISHWNTAYGWDNHATAGYLTSESDPVALAALAAHVAAPDPHPQYLTPAEGDAAYSLLGHTHVAADITDFDTAADARVTAGIATHVGLADPHTQYALESATVGSVTGTVGEITATGTTSVVLSLPSSLTFTGKTVTGGTFNAASVSSTSGALNGTLGATSPNTVAATTLTATGIATIGDNAGTAQVIITGANSNTRAVRFRTNNVERWAYGISSASTELGSDTGSAFAIFAYNDAGTFVDAPIQIARIAGGTINMARPTAFGANSITGSAAAFTGGTLTGMNLSAITGITTVAGLTSVTYGDGTATAGFSINAAAGSIGRIAYNTAGVARWLLDKDSDAEAGSNAGSSLVLRARTDAGAAIDSPISILRAAGGAIAVSRPTIFGHTASITGASGVVSRVQAHSQFNNNAGLFTWSATNGVRQEFGRSKSGTIGTHTALVSGDFIGSFSATGSDGTNFSPAASIQYYVGGPVSAGVVPGRILAAVTDTAGVSKGVLDQYAHQTFVSTSGTIRLSVTDATTTVANDLAVTGSILGSAGTLTDASHSFTADPDTGMNNPAANSLSFNTLGAEAMRISPAQRILIGDTNQSFGSACQLQIHSDGGTYQGTRYANVSGGDVFIVGHTRSTTLGTVGVALANGDDLGTIRFQGDDGTDVNTIGGRVRCRLNAAPTTNRLTGRVDIACASGLADDNITEVAAFTVAGNSMLVPTDFGANALTASAVAITGGTIRNTVMDGGSQNNATDANYTLTPGTSARQVFQTAAITANRTITLSTTGVWLGATFRVTRKATSTGAFTLSVGGLKTLAVSQWAEVVYDGSAWTLAAFGSL